MLEKSIKRRRRSDGTRKVFKIYILVFLNVLEEPSHAPFFMTGVEEQGPSEIFTLCPFQKKCAGPG